MKILKRKTNLLYLVGTLKNKKGLTISETHIGKELCI